MGMRPNCDGRPVAECSGMCSSHNNGQKPEEKMDSRASKMSKQIVDSAFCSWPDPMDVIVSSWER